MAGTTVEQTLDKATTNVTALHDSATNVANDRTKPAATRKAARTAIGSADAAKRILATIAKEIDRTSNPNAEQQSKWTERINKALDFALDKQLELTGRISDLEGDLLETDSVARTAQVTADSALTTADETAGKLAELESSATRLLGLHDKVLVSHHTRIAAIEGMMRTPWVRIVIAVIIGVVVALLWNAHSFAQTVVTHLPNKQTISTPVPSLADSWWAAVLAGVFAAAIVLGFLLLFSRPKKRQIKQEQVVTTDVPQAPEPVTDGIAELGLDKADTHTESTPTKRLPTTDTRNAGADEVPA